MDRCALFVDAGYALADGAMAVHGTRRRDSVSWDHSGLLKLLAGLARDRTGLPVLRCYWYETADGGRTAEHDALAEMPGLKLRLVNTRPGRREGIESQLRRDIVTLAKSGAIADAFIASADEHLAEIVAEVQDLGLRVVVLHIASDGGWTIPQPLRQECDDIVEISAVHLRPFVDLIRGAEPAAEEQYAGGYGSRSRADGDGPMAATVQSALPAQALPALVAGYQATGGPESGPAQPYANSGSAVYETGLDGGRSSAPEQALMAVRGPETDAGSGQLAASQLAASQLAANQLGASQLGASQLGASQLAGQQHEDPAGQVNGSGRAAGPHVDGLPQSGGRPYGTYDAGTQQQAAPGQHAAAERGIAQQPSSGHAQQAAPEQGQRAMPEQAQQAQRGHGQQMADRPAPPYGQHAGGGQHSGQGGAPQRAAQGRTEQHPAHAALEALEQGAYAAGGAGALPPAGHAQPPGAGQDNVAADAAAVGSGPGAGPIGSGSDDGGGRGTGYPDSTATGMHIQSRGYQSGDYRDGGYQSGDYQSGDYQSGEFLSGGFLGAGFQAAPPQGSPGQAGQGQGGPGQGGPGQSGPGQRGPGQAGTGVPPSPYRDGGQDNGYQSSSGAAGPGQTSTVHHLSGLSFPAATIGTSHNGIPVGPSGNGAAPGGGHQGSYTNGSGQNGTGLHAAPGYQNGSAQNAPGQFGSFGGYQPGSSDNGGRVNPGLAGGGSANSAGNGNPVGGNGASGGRPSMNPAGFDAAPVAGQPSPYGANDPGYFTGQAGAGQQARRPGSQPGEGMHARDAYGRDRDAYRLGQAAEPSFQPRAAQQAPPYHAQRQLPSHGSQPAAPLPAVRAAQPVAISLPEAVKAAHSEGFTFGESIGREAPGLWLEAVLARKPRMPSDLEARLLQGSVLPIDSLLHDEVRHSLRRGFWEALESARR